VNLFVYDWPHLHATLNHFPVALLFVTVLFDVAGSITKRESLRAAALWTLWAGVVVGWAAVVAGLQAEDVIDHGEGIHQIMEQHETSALATMAAFTVVLAYKLFRRGNLARWEEVALRVVSVWGFIGLFFTGALGGKMQFDHAAGVPTKTLEAEIVDRAASHHHHPGETEEAEDSAHHHHDEEHEH